MALPLPKVVEDVGPGGPMVTSMRGLNALTNENTLRKINEIKQQYAAITAQADAASKLAYANLMGPQFLAKIMGNKSALGNMTDDQAKSALNQIYRAGTGQGVSNIFSQQQPMGAGTSQGPLTSWITSKLKDAFNHTKPAINNLNAPAPQMPMVPQQQAPAQPQSLGQQPQASAPSQMTYANAHGDNDLVNTAFHEWLNSPEGVQEIAKGEAANIPDEKEIVEWYKNKMASQVAAGNPAMQPSPSQPQAVTPLAGPPASTFAENAGRYEGIEQEGKASGNIRAKDIEALNNAVFNTETNKSTLNQINSILASPEFEQIRQNPLLGNHELSYYAKEGTPAQQQMVGKYYTLTGNLIKDASRDFAGQFRKGEQQLLQGMKPSPADTVDAAKGKSETLTLLNEMLNQRSRLTSQIMNKYHVNKLQALDAADQQLNGDKIRQTIHDSLNPTVTIRNKTTGETKTISVAEARKLGVPNV